MGEFPNKETQFSSENQPENNGRPKGSPNLKTLIAKVWNEEITDDNGNPQLRALLSIKALAEKAEKGDVPAFKELADRLEGKALQKNEHTGEMGFSLFIQNVKDKLSEVESND